MFITNCYDTGFGTNAVGYCVQGRAGEWANYSINVLVPQVYTIEARVAGIGGGGTFAFAFTNGASHTNPAAITIPTNTWTNISTQAYLTSGTTIMNLEFVSNGTESGANTGYVGQFDYISVYPYLPTPTNGTQTNYLGTNFLQTGSSWTSASNNAYYIQQAINGFTNGGLVRITNGTYYISEASPNEAYGNLNIAILIAQNNLHIQGAGIDATKLIAFDRATTIFQAGSNAVACTNFILSDMTLQAQTHIVATNNGGGNVTVSNEAGSYQYDWTNTKYNSDGYVCAFGGANWDNNFLVNNCRFTNADRAIYAPAVTNFTISNCEFTACTTNNQFSDTTNNPGNTNTVGGSFLENDVCVFATGVYNLVIVSNIFNGNNTINTAVVPTRRLAPDGFIWGQISGNVFVGRNTIINHYFEAVQLNAGPNAIAGNVFSNAISGGATCALRNDEGIGDPGVNGGTNGGYLSTFVGNWVCGESSGATSRVDQHSYSGVVPNLLNFSGNYLNYPGANSYSYPGTNAYQGVGVGTETCTTLNMCGNTLACGAYGLFYTDGCGSALVLNNNFGGAFFGGVGSAGQNAVASLPTAQIIGNNLAAGVTFHVQLPPQFTNSFGWFLYNNNYLNGESATVPPFLDPASSSVHVSY